MADGSISEEQKLQKATTELQEAKRVFAEAEMQAGKARMAETDALNRLNDKQKAFDAAVADIKKKPARQSDWGHDQETGFSVRKGAL